MMTRPVELPGGYFFTDVPQRSRRPQRPSRSLCIRLLTAKNTKGAKRFPYDETWRSSRPSRWKKPIDGLCARSLHPKMETVHLRGMSGSYGFCVIRLRSRRQAKALHPTKWRQPLSFQGRGPVLAPIDQFHDHMSPEPDQQVHEDGNQDDRQTGGKAGSRDGDDDGKY